MKLGRGRIKARERLGLLKFHLVLAATKTLYRGKIGNLNNFERKTFSQYGEDGIIEAVFSTIGTTDKFFVEFGVGDGEECNTRFLLEKKGWRGVMMGSGDDNPPFIHRERITAENVNRVFDKHGVPEEFDLLSIDIDFHDYWVWRAMEGFSPRVVVIEYNSTHPPTESMAVAYDPGEGWDGTNYFGASLLALVKLAGSKGYTLVGCESHGVNAFFVRNDLLEGHFEASDIEKLYRPPKYGKKVGGVHTGHPPSDRSMIPV